MPNPPTLLNITSANGNANVATAATKINPMFSIFRELPRAWIGLLLAFITPFLPSPYLRIVVLS
jgi:hypothetical protein